MILPREHFRNRDLRVATRLIYDLGGRARPLIGSVSGKKSLRLLSSRMGPELPAPCRECGFPIGEKRGRWGLGHTGAGALASRDGGAGGAGAVLLVSVEAGGAAGRAQRI